MDFLRRSFRRSTRLREPLTESPNVDSSQGIEKKPSPSTLNRLQSNFRRSFRKSFAPVETRQQASSNTESISMMDKLRSSFRRRSLREQLETGTSQNTITSSTSPSPVARVPFRRSCNGRRGPLFVEAKPTTSCREGIEGPSFTLDKLRRSIRRGIRKPKETSSDLTKINYWQSDEIDVRAGTCFFQVKYLGCIEVFESQGILMCEAAFKILMKSSKRSIKSLLFVSANGLRVVEQNTRALIVGQSLNMLSFCGPVRNHSKGFAFICLNPLTLKWMCYCFIGKETGERLSYAVGCAIRLYFERQEKRDKECKVTMNFDFASSTFTRVGSLRRQRSVLRDSGFNENKLHSRPNSTNSSNTTIININNNINADYDEDKENIPMEQKRINSRTSTSSLDFERSTFTAPILLRQRSFREVSQQQQQDSSTPFKRQLSLRLRDLPSHAERLKFQTSNLITRTPNNKSSCSKTTVSPIVETSPAVFTDSKTLDFMASMMKRTREMQELTEKLAIPLANVSLIRKCHSENAFSLPNTNEQLQIRTQTAEHCVNATSTAKPLTIQDCSLESNEIHLSPSCRIIDLSNNSCNSHQFSASATNNVALTPPATPSPAKPLAAPNSNPWPRAKTQEVPQMISSSVNKFHSRSYSLSHADSMSSRVTCPTDFSDPFNIDWISVMASQKPNKKNTNPFLTDSPIDTPTAENENNR